MVDDPERVAGAGLGADRSPPGLRSDSRPARRRVWVDLDYLFARPAAAPRAPVTVPVADSTSRSTPDRPVTAPAASGPPVRVDGLAAVRRPGRLVVSGEVDGILYRWERAEPEGWVAIVSFLVPFTQRDPRPGQRMDFVAVPAGAVRPNDPGAPPPRSPQPATPEPPGTAAPRQS